MTAHSVGPADRPHVVIVDDEEDLCELLELRLQHSGFRVSSEQTARGCLEVLAREPVDAMIVDLKLEEDDGLQLLEELQLRAADLPVIILTAHGTIENAVEAIQKGAYGFLAKPFDDRDLVQKLRQAVEHGRLRREVVGLRRIVGQPTGGSRLLGTSPALARVRTMLNRVATSDANVLILGESGTGKEVAAQSLHEMSPRRDEAFVAINCGALPSDLLESELFGHMKGAFTGAHSKKDGLFAAAERGTLFLDEIGDAPQVVQVKLLRVLQERAYLPVGSTELRRTDVRIVAATNRDLRADVASGRFREDLFYRLHVVPITMPPLRERPEDIPLLSEAFLAQACARHGLGAFHMSAEALRVLMRRAWPGNVRELANVIEGAAVVCQDGLLRPQHLTAVLPDDGARDPGDSQSACELGVDLAGTSLPPLREAREVFDRQYLRRVLEVSQGNVTMAAKMAGRNRTDFHDLLKRHDLQAAKFRG